MRALGFVAGLLLGWLVGQAMADAAKRREHLALWRSEGVSLP